MLTCVAGSPDIAGSRLSTPRLGSKVPLYASASGLVFLSTFSQAELDEYFASIKLVPFTPHTPITPKQILELLREVRAKGHATCDRYLANNVFSAAVPVCDSNGRVVGSLLTGVEIDRLYDFRDTALKKMLIPMLTAAASEVGLIWDKPISL